MNPSSDTMNSAGDTVSATEQGIRDSLWRARRLLENPQLSCSYVVARVREILDGVRVDLHAAELVGVRERVLPELDGLRARAARPDAIAVRADLQVAIEPVQRLLDGSILAESTEQARVRGRAEALDEVLKLLEVRVSAESGPRREAVQQCVDAIRALSLS